MATIAQINAFITKIAPIIQKYTKQYGYQTCSAIIAQACLESGYGLSGLSAKYNNFFGLKCGSYWKGASVNMATKEEYTTGTMTNIQANFRAYANMEIGVRGYFEFISTPRYASLKETTNPTHYLSLIKQAGYATSSTYIKDNMALVDKYKLYQYDKPQAPTTPLYKDNITIAKEVIANKWGNGEARKTALTKAGYNFNDIQKEVNNLLTPPKLKDVTTIAKEVISNKWGNGEARKQALIKAGYNYTVVQKEVNRLLK